MSHVEQLSTQGSSEFRFLETEVANIGKAKHTQPILEHAEWNRPYVKKSIRELSPLSGEKAKSGILISAGPSVRRKKSIRRILDSGYKGTIIAVDGSYIACLREGLIPDFVVTLDPHRKRIVRWFGDPNFVEHSIDDDYFARQDLDVDFRANSIRQNESYIKLVDQYAHLSKLLISTSAAPTTTRRVHEAGLDCYWWNPLVDSPQSADSITRKLYSINKLPCINTGGNVGTGAWMLAATVLKIPRIAMTGMDFGYYADTPLNETQTYYELADYHGGEQGIERYFVAHTYPPTGERFYTDPTYSWYKGGFLALHQNCPAETINCTEGGILYDESLPQMSLDEFLASEARAH